jgi:tetratricopeptide (TPR) repeat protein
MDTANTQREPLEQLAEAFVERYRRGERPSVNEYAQANPDLAEQIRDLFPALVLMEEGKLGPDRSHARPPDFKLERLGEYRLVRELGRGGMGVVYEAIQESLGRHVALKILPSLPLMDPAHLKRFHREARAAAQLHHPNIVTVFGTGEEQGMHYYAMQFIDGHGLDAVIRQGTDSAPGQKLPPARVAEIGRQVAQALAHAHGQGVLHRDIKPSNLLLDQEGTVWVTDFGLAKTAGPGGDAGEDITHTGDLVGTLRYMAPERFAGWADPRSDLYSLGLTLYELLTLRPAFDAPDRAALIKRMTEQEPIPPRRHDPSIPRDLETIVQKAIAREPADRYQSATELADDLSRFLAGRPIAARRVRRSEQLWRWCRRNPALAGVTTTAVLALLAAVAILAVSTFLLARKEGEVAAAYAAEKQERERMEANLRLALQTVHKMDTEVAEEWLAQEPHKEGLRRQFLEQALEFYEEFARENASHPEVRREVGRAQLRVGHIYHSLGQYGPARLAFERAVTAFDGLAADFPDEPRYRDDLAASHHHLGVLLAMEGKRGPAREHYLAAFDFWTRLAAEFPAEPEYRRSLADSHRQQGHWLAEGGGFEEAWEHYIRAHTLRIQLHADFPAVPSYRQGLAESHGCMAAVRQGQGDRAAAREHHDQALAVQTALVAEFPRHPLYRRDLAEFHRILAAFLTNGDPREAEKHYRQAIALLSPLIADFPTMPHARYLLGLSHTRLGSLLGDRTERAAAEPELRRAIDLLAQVIAEQPSVSEYRHALAGSHLLLGHVLLAAGNRAGAEKQYRLALDLTRRLVRDSPGIPAYRSELATCFYQLGHLLHVDRRRQEAEQAFRESLILRQELVAEFPSLTLEQRSIAAIHYQLASVYTSAGRLEEAKQAYREAVAVTDRYQLRGDDGLQRMDAEVAPRLLRSPPVVPRAHAKNPGNDSRNGETR